MERLKERKRQTMKKMQKTMDGQSDVLQCYITDSGTSLYIVVQM